MDDRSYSPAEVWQTAYGELQLQLPRETFDTWLRHARLIAHEDGTFIVGVHNIYAREWLEHRLKKVIIRTLGEIARRTVEVRFVLAAEHNGKNGRKHKNGDEPAVYTAGPLLAPLKEEEEQAQPRFERLPAGETGLNARQTFETFAVGECNRLAYAAARSVVQAPARQFNPLYVCSKVGLGKTHLLHAIGNACVEKGQRAMYVSSETFTNDLLAAIRGRQTAAFRDKYRVLDVLLLDDVQFLADKDATQEEFFHTFDALFNADSQIVVAGSVPPADLQGIDLRLRSRFEGGLTVELRPPDYLTRLDILEIKTHLRAFDGRVGLDLLERIAEVVDGSVRDVEGALNQVIATALLTEQPPTIEAAEEALSASRSTPREGINVSLEDVVMATAEYYGVSPEDICGRSRARDVSTARQVAMHIAYHRADVALQDIGEMMDGRSHSTVLYNCDRIEDLLGTDSPVRREIDAILRTLAPQEARQRRGAPR